MVGRICERGRFRAGSERVKELWMMGVVNLWKKLNWYLYYLIADVLCDKADAGTDTFIDGRNDRL